MGRADESFNPCYVGLWSVRAEFAAALMASQACFNPCYVGLWSVRILVLPIMD